MSGSKFINHDRASQYHRNVQDPVIRGLLGRAYTMILLLDASPEAPFVLLYFCQVMELFLRDREGLAKALNGYYSADESTGGGL